MIDMAVVEAREQKLIELSKYLKSEFIGLDNKIDQIVENLKIWYLMPEIVDRPIIINIWGMTGTGKTDLIRKLVNFLGFNRRFVELQMGSETKTGYGSAKTVRDLLVYSDLEEGEPAIILFDEFQRFARIKEDGKLTEDKEFDDIWMLLSDGKFSNQSKGSTDYLEDMKEDIYYSIERNKQLKEKGEKFSDKLGRWEKRKYKYLVKKLNWEAPLVTYDDALKLVESIPEDFNIFGGQDFSKSLVFICGNLDSAYSMANSVADADISADVLHKYSLKINLVVIKKSLSGLFKPEQIARLGNNHIIYPCLNSESYRKLILKQLNNYSNNIAKMYNENLVFSDKLITLMQENFVFPSQGVRPVFSGINSILSKLIPEILFHKFRTKLNGDILVDYDKQVFCTYGHKNRLELRYDFAMSDIKKSISKDKLMMYAVHETGHALIYAKLFNYAPKQINIAATSFDGAYVLPNEIQKTKSNCFDLLKVYLAGTLAEEVVFGDTNRSIGCSSDLEAATKWAVASVRHYGFGTTLEYCYPYSSNSALGLDISDRMDKEITQLITKATKEVREELNNERELLKRMVDFIYEKKNVSGGVFCEEFKEDFPEISYIDPLDIGANDEIIDDYTSRYNKFRVQCD